MNPAFAQISGSSGHTLDVTITTPGGGTYSPPAWLIGQTATIQCWGAGADGTTDGGGGGEFAQSNFTFAGDVDYYIGLANANDFTRWDASASHNPQAMSASGSSGGTGGTGAVTYNGGGGARGGTATTRGGGGAAGTTEVGGDGSSLIGGGNGGFEFGGNGGAAGQNGVQPGGGGGADDGVTAPGLGAAGMIRIVYPAIA